MSIVLRWSNVNPSGVLPEQVDIYRSSSPIDPNSLPSPLATLPGSAIIYEDETAVNGETYFYRVRYSLGSETALSSEKEILAPTGAVPPVEPPDLSANNFYMYDSTGRLLFSKEGDKVLDEWASTRKILAAVVAWEEKKDVWDTELVEVTTEDINSTGLEFRSGAEDGDMLTWKGIVELMLVPSMSDMANILTRVLGQHLKDKYGIGETAERAMGYWMSTTALRAGARNAITFTNSSTWAAPDDEIINTNILATPHGLSRCIEFATKIPEILRIMQLTEVSVPLNGGGTLDFPSIDRLRNAEDAEGNLTGYTLEGYVAGKTGDSTWGNQLFSCEMPSGDTVNGAIYHSNTRDLRYKELLRIIMAAENLYPHLRGTETASDPEANNVTLRVLGSSTIEDVSQEGRPLSPTNVTNTSTDYMTETALVFDGTAHVVAGGTPPTFGSQDFTVETFLRGSGLNAGGTESVIGVWLTVPGGRSWLLRITDTHIQFLYSTDGENNTVLGFPVAKSFVLDEGPSHIVAQRTGDELRIYLNGQRSEVFDLTGVTFHTPSSGTDLVLGAREADTGGYEQHLTAHLDEAIITEGVARYGDNGFRSYYRPNRWD